MIDGDSGDTEETVIWRDQESGNVSRRLRDVDEARGMIQEVGSRNRVQNIERSG